MRMTMIIFSVLLSLNLFAATEVCLVEAIDYPTSPGEEVLVFLSTGKVVRISQKKHNELAHLQESLASRLWLEIDTDHNRYITRIKSSPTPTRFERFNKDFQHTSADSYRPSTLRSLDWAKKYFSESKRNEKESQCYNRAHVWSYEWFKKHKFNSSKVFIFFTRKFIREHNFTWWFHVAPSVLVSINGKTRERVMDMKYTAGPTMLKDWIRRFIKTENPGCLSVSSYSEYANFPENGNCYIMKASMYHYWPLDLENEELHGTIKETWVPEEIKTAYLEAFDITK